MRDFPLSSRDIIGLMHREEIVKEAGFIDGFLSTIKDKLHFRTKPFETIFGILGPMWPSSWLIKGLFLIAEMNGFGPGLIGRYIDKKLGFGNPKSPPAFDDAKLKDAAQGTASKILGKVGLKSWAANTMPETGFVKTAASRGILSFLAKASRGWRLSPGNMIYGLLRVFAKGLLALGVFGGVGALLKKKITTQPGVKSDKTGLPGVPTSTTSQPAGTQFYSNVTKNVERTLIHFIDASVGNITQPDGKSLSFSETFARIKKTPLYGSSQMRKILDKVEALNQGKAIQALDSVSVFLGPNVMKMVKFLMPEATYQRITPTQSPQAKTVSKKTPKSKKNLTPEQGKKLEKLLKGV